MRSRQIVVVFVVLAWLLSGGPGAVGQPQPLATETEPLEFRTWSDATGQFRTEAAMVEFAEGKVHLRKKSGSVITVRVGRLSKADQLFVREELKRRRGQQPASREPAPGTADWPGWRGPLRDGKSPDTGLLKQWPPGGPPLLWQRNDIGKGFSSVAVSGGTVYTTGVVGGKLVIFAFDLQGEPKWKVDHADAYTGSHPGSRSTPMIDGGNLYLVSGNGLVGCYDAGTGKPNWTRHFRDFGGKLPGWGYAESVLIYKKLAVVTPGGENCVVALDKTSGQPVWSSKGYRAGAQYGSCYAFTCDRMPMIAAGTAEGIVGISPQDGRVLWTNPFSAHNTANCPTPVYSDGFVFWANGYGKGGICLKLNVRGGQVSAQQAWTTNEMVCHHGGYVILDGYIYGNHSNGWACLELATGRRLWNERAVGKGSLCYADGMLYLFSENGGKAGLATCSPQGMQMAGQFSVQGSGPSWAHPVVIGGRLYLRYDANLYCYNVRAGSQ